MISKPGFIRLTLFEKLKLLYGKGDFIVSIWYYKHKINLFLINGFYVEVFYDPKIDRIAKVEPLESHHTRLKFYADQVKLPVNLFN
jgi:hypothetical protein